jgi:hypothetical protein
MAASALPSRHLKKAADEADIAVIDLYMALTLYIPACGERDN